MLSFDSDSTLALAVLTSSTCLYASTREMEILCVPFTIFIILIQILGKRSRSSKSRNIHPEYLKSKDKVQNALLMV